VPSAMGCHKLHVMGVNGKADDQLRVGAVDCHCHANIAIVVDRLLYTEEDKRYQ
jgi:hypothetical protein